MIYFSGTLTIGDGVWTRVCQQEACLMQRSWFTVAWKPSASYWKSATPRRCGCIRAAEEIDITVWYLDLLDIEARWEGSGNTDDFPEINDPAYMPLLCQDESNVPKELSTGMDSCHSTGQGRLTSQAAAHSTEYTRRKEIATPYSMKLRSETLLGSQITTKSSTYITDADRIWWQSGESLFSSFIRTETTLLNVLKTAPNTALLESRRRPFNFWIPRDRSFASLCTGICFERSAAKNRYEVLR